MSLPDSHSVEERLLYWAEEHPNTDAFVFIDRDSKRTALTCKEMYDQAVLFAKHLRKIGLEAGDIVSNLLPDSPNGFIAFFGIILARCVVVTDKIHLKDGSDLIGNLNRMKCRAMVLSSDVNDECYQVLSRHIDSHDGCRIESKTLPYLSNIVYTDENQDYGFKWTTSITDQDVDSTGAMWTDPNADVLILTTSGTTGKSKLVVHSGRIFQGLDVFRQHEHAKSSSGCLNFNSLCWMSGLPVYYLSMGQKRVCIDKRNPPKSEQLYPFIYNIIIQENCDEISVSLSEMLSLVEYVKSNPNLKKWSLKTCVVGGRPLTKAHIETILPTVETFYNIYGASEVSAVAHKKIEKITDIENFNVGIAIPGCEFVIRDEQNQEMPRGKNGFLYVKSPWIFKRYLGDHETTKKHIDEEGFFSIKDTGYVNDRGELIVFGRAQDVIMRGDDYFHPSSIESVIRTCPEVSDVMVVKVPDSQLVNDLCACVVPREGSNLNVTKIEEFCKEIFVPEDYAHVSFCPRYFITLDRIPLSTNNKPDRSALEKYAAKYFDL